MMLQRYHTGILLPATLFAMLLVIHCSKEYSGVGVPEVTTRGVDQITTNAARCGGSVEKENGFEVTAFGILVSDYDDFRKYDSLPCKMDQEDVFYGSLLNLNHGRQLYLRAWAVNKVGTGYGKTVSYIHTGSGISFNPDLTYDTLTDVDGNNYLTIKIGTQRWMAENLKTTHYNDGTPIPYLVPNEDWDTMLAPAYSWYLNDEAGYKATYGALYNWWTANTGKLCPIGWHVPDSVEWTKLVHFWAVSGEASTHLKEAGDMHWILNNEGDNLSGFTALPGGYRANSGWFYYLGYVGHYWASTKINQPQGNYFVIIVNGGTGVVKCSKQFGLNVRCLQD
jgi:uncharacterized protein (TIGR02145 family)